MKLGITLPLTATLVLSSGAIAQSVVRSFAGSTSGLHVGTAIDYLPDINGDGYEDMVVGGPNPNGQGAIYFVSGKYLQTGTGLATLGATFGPTNSEFGRAVVAVGDVTGDGVSDVLVGLVDGTILSTKFLSLVSGATKLEVASEFGSAVSAFGDRLERFADYDGDGYADVLVHFAGGLTGGPGVSIYSPRKMFLGASNAFLGGVSGSTADGFGDSFSAGDLDGDGKPELVVGAPHAFSDAGRVYVYRGSNLSLLRTLASSTSSQFGASVDATRDLDGDGVVDLVVGAPYSDATAVDGGEVIVHSGARVAANAPPFDLVHWTNGQAGAHFGAAVASTPDMNGDFRSEVAVGAPDVDVLPPLLSDNGAVYLYSGETLETVGHVTGSNGDSLGATLSRAWDYTGDIRWELAAGGPDSNASATDGGVMRILSVFPNVPTTYCTPKTNSLGCTPLISYSGSPSVSSGSPFLIKAANILNKKNGLLFYGYDALSSPFQGGTLCVKGPTKRTAVQHAGGSTTGSDCTGSYSYDFNARIQSGVDPALALQGQEVFCQYWSRDIASPSGTSLTNALRFVVNP